MAHLLRNCVEYVPETWLGPTDGIRVFAFDLEQMSHENGLQSWLIANEDM